MHDLEYIPIMRQRFCITPLIALIMVASRADAGEIISGPVEAQVLRVIDGDTVEAEALVWPGHSVRVAIRIRGIDAPELRGGCDAEKAAALTARDVLAELLAAGWLEVRNIGADKYFGRVVADVVTSEGSDVAEVMITRSVARAYDGGHRKDFCGG